MSDDRESIYKAKPLVGPRDIRVLDIEPAEDFDAAIRCSLRIISLDSSEDKYQTLSYAWASFENCKSLYCDGKPLTVTNDLELALKRIREKMNSKAAFPAIWIDAICINQDDMVEKGKQVAMMGDIYAKSRRLIAWLGEASNDQINDVRTAIQNPKAQESAGVLSNVARRTWFGRGWVIQEVFKSPRDRRHALLGNFQCRLDTLILSYHTATGDWEAAPLLRGFRDNLLFKNASAPKPQRPGDALPCLLANLVIFRDAKFSKAHDRIFALLSISSDTETIPVDYEQDLHSLYLNVAISRIGLPRRPSVLLTLALLLRNERSADLGLPSWIPDWQVVNELSQSDVDDLRDLFYSHFREPSFLEDRFWGKPIVDEHHCIRFTGLVLDLPGLATCGECHQEISSFTPWSDITGTRKLILPAPSQPIIFFLKPTEDPKVMELKSLLVLSRSRKRCIERHARRREVCIR